MFNEELVRYYLRINDSKVPLMPDVQYTDIVMALNKHFFGDWTYEVTSDTIIKDGTGDNLLTTVALYTKGKLCVGRSYCKVKDAADNHLRALYNASLVFIDKSSSGNNRTPQNETAIQPQQMTADQVAALANGNGNFVNNVADFVNYTDNNNMPANSVPLDNISEQGYKQVEGFNPYDQYDPTQSNQQQPVQQQPVKQQPQQQNNPNRNYTQEQINKMKQFQSDFGITDDNMLNNWINDWHKGWTKGNIHPGNIDEFIDYSRQRGEMMG